MAAGVEEEGAMVGVEVAGVEVAVAGVGDGNLNALAPKLIDFQLYESHSANHSHHHRNDPSLKKLLF